MFELTPAETRELAETIVADSDRTEVHATWENSPGWIRRKGRATWRYNNRHLTTTVVVDALDGRNAGIGTYFGNEQGTVKRILFDVDKHDRETHEAETDRFDLQSALGRFEVPYLIARSKSGQGYHLEIRFTVPLSTSKARRFGKVLLGKAGTQHVGLFPKQDRLDGRVGNQVARPGSRYWFEKTGGSVYIDRATLEPIPVAQWAGLITQSACVTEAEVDAFLAEYAPPVEEKKVSVDLLRAYQGPKSGGWSVKEMERFLDSRGIEYSQAQDGSGNWSHIFRLRECPNADQHSHDRGGAAIFVDEATQRAGFNCFHAHCEELRWKDIRRLIDPSFSFRLQRPAGDHNTLPESGDKLKPRGMRGNSEQERAIMRWASAEFNRAANYRFRKRLRRAAACGRTHQELECSGSCGPRGVRVTPCDDPALCRYCSRKRAYLIREHARDTWPQVAWFRVKVKAGDHEAHRSERERIKKLFQGTGAYPRWVTGWDHIDFFLPAKQKGYARSLSPEGGWEVKIISSAEAAEKAANTWLTLHQECMAIIASAETVEDVNELLKIEWVKRPGLHRTGGGRAACEQLPWFSLAEAREVAKEQALEKRGGVPLDCCGNEYEEGCFCRKPLNSTLIFTPTGEKICKRLKSVFNDYECIEHLDRSPIEESYYRKWQRLHKKLE